MASDSFEQLRGEYARGAFEKLDLESERCFRFEDATLWFPDGYRANGEGLGLMFLSWPPIFGFIGAAIGIHDGYAFGWYCLVVAVLGSVLFWAAFRESRRKKRAKEEQLACGVFLFSDRIVTREPGYDRVCSRESFFATKTRTGRDHRDHAKTWLTLCAKDGHEDLHTQLDKCSRKLVNRWLLEEAPPAAVAE